MSSARFERDLLQQNFTKQSNIINNRCFLGFTCRNVQEELNIVFNSSVILKRNIEYKNEHCTVNSAEVKHKKTQIYYTLY